MTERLFNSAGCAAARRQPCSDKALSPQDRGGILDIDHIAILMIGAPWRKPEGNDASVINRKRIWHRSVAGLP